MYELSKTIVHDRLQAAERARLAREVRLRRAARDRHPDVDQLHRLLAGTAALPTSDVEAWSEVRSAAAAATRRLAADGEVPRHLVVGPTEPAVAIPRMLLAAVRRLERRSR